MKPIQITNTNLMSGRSFRVSGRRYADFVAYAVANAASMDEQSLRSIGVQNAQAMFTAPNVPALDQFLQSWLPGVVRQVTSPRRARELMGFTQQGSFHDQTIVWRQTEILGRVDVYGDLAAAPRSNYNVEYVARDVARFKGEVSTEYLQNARMSATGFSDLDEKTASLARQFAIIENQVSFLGWSGQSTYGVLNDPNMPAYVTVAATGTGSSTLWSTKTWAQQQADIIESINGLIAQTDTAFDPYSSDFDWWVSATTYGNLSNTNTLGLSLKAWLIDNYPGIRIKAVPEFAAANGGQDVWYMVALSKLEGDDSTDSGLTIENLVQSTMFTIATLPNKEGGTTSVFGSASAGVGLKRPFLVVRRTGM